MSSPRPKKFCRLGRAGRATARTPRRGPEPACPPPCPSHCPRGSRPQHGAYKHIRPPNVARQPTAIISAIPVAMKAPRDFSDRRTDRGKRPAGRSVVAATRAVAAIGRPTASKPAPPCLAIVGDDRDRPRPTALRILTLPQRFPATFLREAPPVANAVDLGSFPVAGDPQGAGDAPISGQKVLAFDSYIPTCEIPRHINWTPPVLSDTEAGINHLLVT